MIADREEMKQIENASGESVRELMGHAGSAVANELKRLHKPGTRLLILAGKGNNGGDAYAAAADLLNIFEIRIYMTSGRPSTEAADYYFAKVNDCVFVAESALKESLEWTDIVLDGVFGFSYHGMLSAGLQQLFDLVNDSGKKVYSIDINSGAESDTGFYDRHALRSDITFALDCYKPFHMMRKEHGLFREAELLSLGLPHVVKTKWEEMNESIFFAAFPRKKENAYKGTYGKTLLIGGSYGMAGALSWNITGARAVGASYIEAAMTHDIYPIEAVKHTGVVFHPFGHDDYMNILEPAVMNAKSAAFGSGAVNMDRKNDILDLILQYSHCPVVLDAEALQLLVHNTWVLRYASCPVILTPHIGEFSRLVNKPASEINLHRISAAEEFAAHNKVILVLKGANTIICDPEGRCCINQSGNAALAQAGSGDILTGMIAGMLTMVKDVFKAVCMAVWLHGYIADRGLEAHSMQNFPLEDFPHIMDQIFREKGY